MLNLKLKTIASLVNKEDIVIDIGCDHAYLAIYLKENQLCREVFASDVSENVVDVAKNNISKHQLSIPVYLSDGLLNIKNKNINTAVISGMGTSTILNIIKNAPKNVQKYIISSNNDYEELRSKMLNFGFYVQEEIVVKDHKKFYPVMVFTKDFKRESKLTLKYGKSQNKEYFTYLLEKKNLILSQIPKKRMLERFQYKKEIRELKKLI